MRLRGHLCYSGTCAKAWWVLHSILFVFYFLTLPSVFASSPSHAGGERRPNGNPTFLTLSGAVSCSRNCTVCHLDCLIINKLHIAGSYKCISPGNFPCVLEQKGALTSGNEPSSGSPESCLHCNTLIL